MRNITFVEWSRATQAFTSTTDLKILSAILSHTYRNDALLDARCNDRFQGSWRWPSSHHGHLSPIFNAHARARITSPAFPRTFHKRRLHITTNRVAPKVDATFSQGSGQDLIDLWEHDQARDDSASGSTSLEETCSLCGENISSEDMLDEHLVSCWSRHQGATLFDPRDESPSQSEDPLLAEEQEKLDVVRRLEHELRKARRELRSISQRRRLDYVSMSTIDGYSKRKINPDTSLSRDDYLNLVDLYFHAKQITRAALPDASPTPLFLEDQEYQDLVAKPLPGPKAHALHSQPPLLEDVERKLRRDKLKELRLVESFIDLLLDDTSNYDTIFQTYQKFPSPGVRFLPAETIRTFLRRMGLPPKKSSHEMLTYLSLLDDMQKASLPITEAEWNTAIHLAGKSFTNIKEEDLERSIQFWKRMELEANVKASAVTFNILFDVAVKAGQFRIAGAFLEIMDQRGLRLNRIGRVSHMWYCGRLGDAEAVRKAYHDFVEAGEVVDTLVLNAAMVSLCTAGEGEAAEQIYERMKSIASRRTDPATSKQEFREVFTRYPPPGPQNIGKHHASYHLRRILIEAPKLRFTAAKQYEAIESSVSLTPDIITYRIFLSDHVKKTGNIDRITVLLDDMMRIFHIPPNTMIFLILFKGFAINGNRGRSRWSAPRLRALWDLYRTLSERSRSKFRKRPSDAAIIDLLSGDKSRQTERMGLGEESGSSGSGLPAQPSRWGSMDTHAKQQGLNYHANDIDLHKSRIFNDGPWGRFLRDFTLTQEQREELDMDADPAGQDEPQAFPYLSEDSLEETDMSRSRVRPSKWLIIWAIRAFATVTQSRKEVEEIYFYLVDRWENPTSGQLHSVNMTIQTCLRDLDSGRIQQQWWRRRQGSRSENW